MKSKWLLIDLAICSVWMLCSLCNRDPWNPAFVFVVLGVLSRFVVSFALFRQEKRTWITLGWYAVFTVLMLYSQWYNGINEWTNYFFIVTGLEYSSGMKAVMEIFLVIWLLVMPYVYYLVLLFRRELVRTELDLGELSGGLLWHDQCTRHCSAVLMVMLVALMTGLTMDARLCQVTCLTAVPFTYWLLCHYFKVGAKQLWILVLSMLMFWYAQLLAGVWRVSLLLVSLALVVYVVSRLFKITRNFLLVNGMMVYLGVILPSFSIGYNQYACLNYARSGFGYLEPFRGILFITDSTGKLYGLRDRYGMLLEPEYNQMQNGGSAHYAWRYVYVMKKDSIERHYDVLNNEFIDDLK